MYNPESTYRIQFNKDFTFARLEEIIPYLDRLGIKTIYASPVFAAVPGSTHGYDGIDPCRINPEIGTEEDLYRIAGLLRERGMGWLQDFVPNHMAYTPANAWLCDFLEKGKMSRYDSWFDKNPDEPLMAPFLGAPLEDTIADGELSLVFSRGKLQLRHHETEFPLNYTAYYEVISHELMDAAAMQPVKEAIDLLSEVTDKVAFDMQWQEMLNHLNARLSTVATEQAFCERLERLSADTAFLQRIADLQFYRLCCWKETMQKINYRRFFTVNGLVCMNMQHREVFDAYHELLLKLVRNDVIQGIRIDHIDGLYDPSGYLRQLRAEAGAGVYIVVEKILGDGESLPPDWPVQGATGYEFMAEVNNVLTGTSAEAVFTSLYRSLDPSAEPEHTMLYHYKEKILREKMGGELANLVREFMQLPGLDMPEEIGRDDIREVIASVLVCLPVYRYYPAASMPEGHDAAAFSALIDKVRKERTVHDRALSFFKDCFTSVPLLPDDAYGKALLHFWRRCMQVSGPLMAKGMEDTLFYNYHRYAAHNEVGGNPFRFGITVDEFHDTMQQRRRLLPDALNATATHDTKRGEDARARLQLLSADPDAWQQLSREWLEMPADAYPLLTAVDRYFMLQVALSSLPFEKTGRAEFLRRLEAYTEKAAREAGHISSWETPATEYEQQLKSFAADIVQKDSPYGRLLRAWLNHNQPAVILNSLVQAVLKLTCPGIPDIYQGTEFWDLSLVDPDNRRPVDYDSRVEMLQRSEQLLLHWKKNMLPQPGLKQALLQRLLLLRRRYPELFREGTYEPVAVSGRYLSFIRRYRQDWLWVILPLGGEGQELPHSMALPAEAPETWKDVLTGKRVRSAHGRLSSGSRSFPVRILMGSSARVRKAGVLMPLFSLPSSYGAGGMGSEAYDFITFLARGGQKLWQLLPLNPVLEENHYSPYAAVSAFAGDPMYIDPEVMEQQGFPVPAIDPSPGPDGGTRVGYRRCREEKTRILRDAWRLFRVGAYSELKSEFVQFREQQGYWLDDYALYTALKIKFGGEPWYSWPAAYRDRDPDTLEAARRSEADEFGFAQWQQFVWQRQWTALRQFARQYDIALMGDLPFYMNTDSVDIWAQRRFFAISDEGRVKAMAGVPPDYFSETGQLWGMPVYDWKAMKEDKYSWWLRRLQRNIDLYDKVRLDHFRAFFDYWEVPGGSDNAINGAWREGPQDGLFRMLQQQFPDMPFIAEDLGEIHKGVFAFKDRYGLPGMHILQFGFDPYDPHSHDLPEHIARNAVVYTGTHDNNTVAGWFPGLGKESLAALKRLVRAEVTADNIADTLCRIAYNTNADTVIIPIQDILGLDASARINTPSTTEGNWAWRLQPGQLTLAVTNKLLAWVKQYRNA